MGDEILYAIKSSKGYAYCSDIDLWVDMNDPNIRDHTGNLKYKNFRFVRFFDVFEEARQYFLTLRKGDFAFYKYMTKTCSYEVIKLDV